MWNKYKEKREKCEINRDEKQHVNDEIKEEKKRKIKKGE